MKVMLFCC